MSICNNALSNIKTTKNKNRLTFVLELMWKTDEEIEVKKTQQHYHQDVSPKSCLYLTVTKPTYLSLTSRILLAKASLFSFAFLLKFSAFNPSLRKCSRSVHSEEKVVSYSNFPVIIQLFYILHQVHIIKTKQTLESSPSSAA